MKKVIYITAIILVFIIVSNLTPMQTLFKGLPVYNYTSNTDEFKSIEIPWKGIEFENTLSSFKTYKEQNTNDTILYRNFSIQPLHFWNWYEYTTHKRYRLPYKKQIITF